MSLSCKTEEEDDEFSMCGFCFDDVNKDNKYIGCLNCNHTFHYECCEKWHRLNCEKAYNDSCIRNKRYETPKIKCIQCTTSDDMKLFTVDCKDTKDISFVDPVCEKESSDDDLLGETIIEYIFDLSFAAIEFETAEQLEQRDDDDDYDEERSNNLVLAAIREREDEIRRARNQHSWRTSHPVRNRLRRRNRSRSAPNIYGTPVRGVNRDRGRFHHPRNEMRPGCCILM